MAPVIDIFPDGQWIDITSDHKAEAGLQEGRGRQAATDTTSTSLTVVLKNDGGKYSSDRPGTPYYRTLGRGTHIRVRDILVRDPFTRSTASSWGSTPNLIGDKPNPVLAWSNGSGSASDYSTTGTTARHTLTSTNVARQSRLDLMLRPVMVRTSVTIGALTTGASARAAVVVRKTPSGTAHYRAELEYTTAGTVIPRISRLGGPGSATLATGTTGAYSAAQKWWIVCMAVGPQLYMRAWPDGTTEPTTWLEAEDVHLRRGQVALRSTRDTSNTNSNLTVDFDDFELSHPDFYGGIWSMRPMAGQGGHELTMTVQAGGVLQRLSNTDKPARSSLYTSMSTGDSFGVAPVAYWPLEDGARAEHLEQTAAAGRPGALTGPVRMGSDSSLAGSAPLPVVTGSGVLSGRVPAFQSFDASTDLWTVLWLMKIDEPPDVEATLVRFATSAPAAAYEVAMNPAGELILRGPKLWQTSVPTYVFSVSEPYDDVHLSGFTSSPTVWGEWVTVLIGNDPGSDSVFINWNHATAQGAGGSTLSYPDPALVWREPNGAWTMTAPQGDSVSYGHVGVYDGVFDITTEITSGYVGERARNRFSLTAAHAGIPVQTVGTGSEPMGPRLLGTTVENLEDSAAADWGIMSEPRHQLGLEYTARQHLYNQAPAMTIDCSDGQLNDGLSPIRDDARGLVTEVIATRPGGSPETFAVPDGDVHHLTSEAAPAGIGGVIQGTLSPNVETDRHAHQQAAWTVHLGASREPRYEQIKLLLHSPAYANDVQRYADAIAVSEGEVIRLVNPPPLIAATIPPGAIDLMVQGIERQRDGETDELVWNCTPAPPWEVWGLDASNSRIELAADDDETALKVSVEVGPGWKTNPDPGWYLQGMTGGEAMLVTGCTTDTPAFIAAGTIANGNNASLVPGLPAGMTPGVGQSMFLMASIRNSGTGTCNAPAGWSAIVTNGNMAVFHRYYLTGDTAPTVTFTGGVAGADTQARIFGFSGLSRRYGGAPSALKAAKRTPGPTSPQQNSSAQNISYPAYYVHRDNSVVMIFAWKQDDWTGVAPPAGFTEMADNPTTTGDDSGIAAYYQIQTAATNIPAGSLVVTGGVSAISRASVVAFRPLQTLVVGRAVNGMSGNLAFNESIHVWRHGAVPL